MKMGAHIRSKSPEKIFVVVPLHFFGSTSTQLVVFVSARVKQYSLVSVFLLFYYSRCPQCSAICKSGDTRPRALWSRRQWLYCLSWVFFLYDLIFVLFQKKPPQVFCLFAAAVSRSVYWRQHSSQRNNNEFRRRWTGNIRVVFI